MSSPTTPEPRALDVEGLRELEKNATPGPWIGAHIRDEQGNEFESADDIAAYVKRCVEAGDDLHFHAIVAEQPDGTADVSHFGNGPRSVPNMMLAAALRNALPALLDAAEERDAAKKCSQAAAEALAVWTERCLAAEEDRDQLREELDSTITALGEIQDRALAERAAHARTREERDKLREALRDAAHALECLLYGANPAPHRVSDFINKLGAAQALLEGEGDGD